MSLHGASAPSQALEQLLIQPKELLLVPFRKEILLEDSAEQRISTFVQPRGIGIPHGPVARQPTCDEEVVAILLLQFSVSKCLTLRSNRSNSSVVSNTTQ